MNLECLDNLIGISRDACENIPSPTSGLYICDVPYATLEIVSKISSDKDAHTCIKRCLERSYIEVYSEMNKYLMPYMSLNSAIEQVIAGRLSGTKFLPPTNAERGLHIMRVGNNMHDIEISQIQILSLIGASNIDVNIKDGTYNTVYTIPTLIGGQINRLNLNPSYKMKYDEIYITLDNTNLNVDEGSFVNTNSWAYCGCGNQYTDKDIYDNNYAKYNNILRARGWDGSVDTYQTYGLSVSLSVHCNMERIICLLKKEMTTLYYYKTLINLCDLGIHSIRSNEAINRDQFAYAKTDAQKAYTEAYKAFADSVRTYMQSIDTECITCKGVTYALSV